MLHAAVTALLFVGVQDPAPKAGVTDAAAEKTKVETVKVLTDDEAKAALDAFKQAAKGKQNLATRMRAVSALGEGSHAKLVVPLAKAVKKEKKLSVRRTAAKALGHQPAKMARPALVKLLRDKKVTIQPMVAADLVTALDKAGYKSADWKHVQKLFGNDFAEERHALQKAIFTLAKNHKEQQAIPLLLEHLDEPAPKDVNSADNPPAEYWKARWFAWRSWRADVKSALFASTGQRFSTSQEARTWLSKNRRKLKKRR